MPELPEVEAVVRKVRAAAIGAEIAAVRTYHPRGAHPQTPADLDPAIGRTIRSVERRGKHILIGLEGGLALRVHLRMTGNLAVIPDSRLHSIAVRVLFAFRDGRGLAFEDVRMLGAVNLFTASTLGTLMDAVGVDADSPAFTVGYLKDVLQRSQAPIKLFLMDQKRIGGLGNIYAAESLFRARIQPERAASSLPPRAVTKLHRAIGDVLADALRQAIASYAHPGSHDGMEYFVYDREGLPCRVCGKPVLRLRQGGRSTYYCGKCQKVPRGNGL